MSTWIVVLPVLAVATAATLLAARLRRRTALGIVVAVDVAVALAALVVAAVAVSGAPALHGVGTAHRPPRSSGVVSTGAGSARCGERGIALLREARHGHRVSAWT